MDQWYWQSSRFHGYIYLFIFHLLRTMQLFPTNKNHTCIMILLPSHWVFHAYFSWVVPKLCYVPLQDLHFFLFLSFTFQSVFTCLVVPLTCRCLWTRGVRLCMRCTRIQIMASVNHALICTWFFRSFMPNMFSMSNLLHKTTEFEWALGGKTGKESSTCFSLHWNFEVPAVTKFMESMGHQIHPQCKDKTPHAIMI